MKIVPKTDWVLASFPGEAPPIKCSSCTNYVQERQVVGTVLAVGPGDWNYDRTHRNSVEYRVGEKILFKTGDGVRVEHEGKPAVLLWPNDIIAGVIE